MVWLERVSQMSRNNHEARELAMQMSKERASPAEEAQGQSRGEGVCWADSRNSKGASVSEQGREC